MNTLRRALPYVLIAALTWVAHFWHFRQFGLYEDDYHFIVTYFDAPLSSFPSLALDALTHWPQGRPLQSIMPPLITMVLFPIGGLRLLYLAAYGIVAVSAVLAYRFAKHVSESELFAAIAVIAFILFPADTTHPLLVHAFCYRLGLICGLWAALLYLKDRRLAAYAVAFISLMLYEPPLLIFLAAPLLANRGSQRRGWRELAVHAALCAGMLSITVLIRVLGRESRIAMAGQAPVSIGLDVLRGLVFGPLMAGRQLSYGPLRTVAEWDATSLIAAVGVIPMLYLWLRRAWISGADEVHQQLLIPGKLIAASGVMFVVSYLLSFTHNPMILRGRFTSMQIIPAVGGSLFFAAVAYAVLGAHRSRAYRQVVIGLLAIHFGVMVGYRSLIQADFAAGWQTQQGYWTRLLALTEDRTDGTVILVDGPPVPQTEFIDRFGWTDPDMIRLMFRLPDTWAAAPAALPLFHGAEVRSASGPRSIYWNQADEWYAVEPGNVILLRYDGERLVRVDGLTATIQGVVLHLRQPTRDPTRDAAPYPPRPLHKLLVDPGLLE